jgi:hypothetical protein
MYKYGGTKRRHRRRHGGEGGGEGGKGTAKKWKPVTTNPKDLARLSPADREKVNESNADAILERERQKRQEVFNSVNSNKEGPVALGEHVHELENAGGRRRTRKHKKHGRKTRHRR